MNWISNQWSDYTILDAGDGEKLERWKDVVLRRPDPQCLWPKDDHIQDWKHPDAFYHRSSRGGGSWDYHTSLPESWIIDYKGMKLKVSPTGFKHTGIFPEQATNWDFMQEKIRHCSHPVKVLNLFAYTGAATMACSLAGAEEVVHLDAAKGMVAWAKENMELNHLEDHTIRFLVDDAYKFVLREKRRGHQYDAIIMDPPSYGRGPNGEMWKLEKELPKLIDACKDILVDDPLFFIINTYSKEYTPLALENLMRLTLQKDYPQHQLEVAQLCLPIENRNILLPCGISGRFYR